MTTRESLEDIGYRCGTDKSRICHSYLDVYEKLFPGRDEPITMLELGVQDGRSLRCWRKYFSRATIVGVDWGPPPPDLLSLPDTHTYQSDQADPQLPRVLAPHAPFDVIIDDASHLSPKTIASFELLWPLVKPGGIYVVEDVSCHPDVVALDYIKALTVHWGHPGQTTAEALHALYSQTPPSEFALDPAEPQPRHRRQNAVTAVSGVMLGHNNESRFLPILDGLFTALRHCELDAELIVVDNSERPLQKVAEAVAGGDIPGQYHWQGGRNLLYGPAMNVAANLAKGPLLLYVCSNHGESRDPTWPLDLLAPLADERVAMTGCLQPSGPPEKMGFLVDLPPVHIQGGVLAARTETILTHPYTDGRCAHWYSDIVMSLRLMAAGWKLIDVPTIKSVWASDPGEGEFKYVHRGG